MIPTTLRRRRDTDSRGGYGSERGYGSTERVNEPQALTPFDEEKAWAQYNDGYGPPEGYGNQGRRPPPPASSTVMSDRTYDDRDRDRDRRYDDRDRRHDDGGRSRYDDRDDRRRVNQRSRYDDDDEDDYYRDRERDRDRRSHDRPPPSIRSEDDYSLRKHRSPTEKKTGKDFLGQSDSERGLGATLLGGAAGAFLGDQADKGILGTVGGAVLGALAAKAGEKQIDKRQQKKEGTGSGRRRDESDYMGSPD
ncbi:hypothetical protein LTR53_006626 [Teratosphaeriaceae sp. CCFEE 6253]|nr:hypothetical protein LTR53_006626 [Teratosphaeriaceae sp. CCFEE 6253]